MMTLPTRCRVRLLWALLPSAFCLLPSAFLAAERLDLALPTANDAIFGAEPWAFYQYVERNFQEQTTYPWEGGQYGFVRDPVEGPGGMVFTRFHEGLDIKPLRRDAREEPLDEVNSVAPGRVVHVSPLAGGSNYGKYVVVEHRWDGCPYYSLYAHLGEIAVAVGQPVTRGAALGRMGYTGAGINRARAHLHFELNLMLSGGFDQFYQASAGPSDPNKHGLFNGQNLAGLDVARLFLELRKNPALTLPEFLAKEETFFKVLLPAGPAGRPPDLLSRYPWMGAGSAPGALRPAAWEVSFTRNGCPLKALPATTTVAVPTLSYAKPADVPYWQLTHRLLFGAGKVPVLSPYGRRLMDLLMVPTPDPNAAPTPSAGHPVVVPPKATFPR